MTTLKELWNCEFIKFTQEELDKFNVPHDTGALLVNLGLPKDHYTFEYSEVRFYDSRDLKQLTFNGTAYIIIGQISYGKICINLNAQEVYLIQDDESSSCYVNSSLEKFLLMYVLFYNQLATLDDNRDEIELSLFAKDLKNKFREFDPKALNEKENYWSTILEEYENCAI